MIQDKKLDLAVKMLRADEQDRRRDARARAERLNRGPRPWELALRRARRATPARSATPARTVTTRRPVTRSGAGCEACRRGREARATLYARPGYAGRDHTTRYTCSACGTTGTEHWRGGTFQRTSGVTRIASAGERRVRAAAGGSR